MKYLIFHLVSITLLAVIYTHVHLIIKKSNKEFSKKVGDFIKKNMKD